MPVRAGIGAFFSPLLLNLFIQVLFSFVSGNKKPCWPSAGEQGEESLYLPSSYLLASLVVGLPSSR